MAASTHKLVSAASTNATLIRAGYTNLIGISLHNTTAGNKTVKFYDKATAPVVGTDVPVLSFPIPGNWQLVVNFDEYVPFRLGLAMAITLGVPDNDTTAVAAADVVTNTWFL